MRKYRVLTIFLAVMLLLTGCGGSSEGKTDSDTTTKEASVVAEEASSEDVEAASESTGVTGTAVGGSIRDEVISAITIENAEEWGICGADLIYLISSDGVFILRGTGEMENYNYTGTSKKDTDAPWELKWSWSSTDEISYDEYRKQYEQSGLGKTKWLIIEDGCTWISWPKFEEYSIQLLVLPESLDIGVGEKYEYIKTTDIYWVLENGTIQYRSGAYDDNGELLDFSQYELYSSSNTGTSIRIGDEDIKVSEVWWIKERITSNDDLISLCQDIPVVEYAGVQYTGEEFGELWSQKLEESRGYGYISGD